MLDTTRDRHRTESALLTGVLLAGAAFWALLIRAPVPPHPCSVSFGFWLLVVPSLRCFQSPVASHHSRAVGLLVVALSAWAMWTGPRIRPPMNPSAVLARQEPIVALAGRDAADVDPFSRAETGAVGPA
ncbi:MAG TPA: hypothetical protein VF468_26990 [Actinomycetota bacterium]|nr:hypothetical protein [Actinomycetota bacterium]